MMAERADVGLRGALTTDDPGAKGRHIPERTSNPQRALQEDSRLKERNLPETVESTALACKGNRQKKVPRAKDWRAPSLVKTIAQ